MTLLLLVAPAVGFSCELASALCGPGRAERNGVEAPPCHGMPDGAMDCCSVRTPAEPPLAAALGGCELPASALGTGVAAQLPPTPVLGVRAVESSLLRHAPDPDRCALFSVFLL